ncbi:TIGR04283 family arsenosugar biosynthesis glycosyltransferase [Candidatus Uabimicrobium sp. HlEnr_7]|uniref:TIGR04283 family arsenosugar biosynthesis glycosyltransferase n=1 Tax=Candidatus Uabimicrobium helgolandensis TaxID=3095367 RepID=UPI00355626FB
MYKHNIDVIIPVLNEELSIGKVLQDMPNWVRNVIVVDNGCTDNTAAVAKKNGAIVVHEPLRGYGAACLKGMSVLDNPDIVVFVDGDYSDRPQQMNRLVEPIIAGEVEMVIGSRVLGKRERGALTPQARFGNWLSCHLIFALWRVRYTDLGPFRAISYTTLTAFSMQDLNYGWTVEMQIKAAIRKIPVTDVAVDYHKRIGISKISGTVSGVIGAGYKILTTIFKYAISDSQHKQREQKKRVILFSKYPLPGKSKTRMIPALGKEGAANLQREMTEFIVNHLHTFSQKNDSSLEVRFFGGSKQEMIDWLGDDVLLREQVGQDLGQKMYQAFSQSFTEGVKYCVITGADCPEVNEETLRLTFLHLKSYPLVIGPAVDGGYYLIAMTKRFPQIFANISWGSSSVLEATLAAAKQQKMPYKLLPILNDVDLPEDLYVWKNVKNNSAENIASKISVIIPCLDEEQHIKRCLQSVVGKNIECIVVDGGSTDQTVTIARTFKNVQVLSCEKGRYKQLNYGAQHAKGNHLLFLHADSQLPKNFSSEVRRIMNNKNISAGAFTIELDSDDIQIKKMETGINRRSRYLNIPYGDQGIFVNRSVFEKTMGFPSIIILEDFVFVMRLRKLGKIEISPLKMLTSARKWERSGPWRTWLINQCIVVCFYFGLPHQLLRRWYDE